MESIIEAEAILDSGEASTKLETATSSVPSLKGEKPSRSEGGNSSGSGENQDTPPESSVVGNDTSQNDAGDSSHAPGDRSHSPGDQDAAPVEKFLNLQLDEVSDASWKPSSREETDKFSVSTSSTEEGNESNVFVLCLHCARMIYIESKWWTLQDIIPSDAAFSLVATACRHCRTRLWGPSPQVTPIKISPNIIRHSYMYDCAHKIAGEEVELCINDEFGGADALPWVSLEQLTEALSVDCRVQGVDTSEQVLQRAHDLRKDDLILPYVPGSFF